ERLLLDGVALQPGDVAEGDLEPAGVVEADLADPAQAIADEAAVPAGQAADAAGLGPAQLWRPRGGEPVEQVGQRLVRHPRRLHPCLLPLPHTRTTRDASYKRYGPRPDRQAFLACRRGVGHGCFRGVGSKPAASVRAPASPKQGLNSPLGAAIG